MNSGHKALPGEPLQWQCLHSSKKDRSQIHVPTSSFRHHTLPGVERPAWGWEIAASKITDVDTKKPNDTSCMQPKEDGGAFAFSERASSGRILSSSILLSVPRHGKHAKLPHLRLSVSVPD